MVYFYKDSKNVLCTGEVKILSAGSLLELDICANGWDFHAIIGSHRDGRFLCIPNWDIGIELSRLGDSFWNEERLRYHSSLHPDNIKAVVGGIHRAGEWIEEKSDNS